ncbi:peptidase S1 [Halomonas sp. JS92-SW72]|uniref:peptidase S1 n=1 Tax=Halomonas sp. JS92-SW72 TaxID=2306583 RepID=UPI000E5B2FEA|nr:peptidase S1 [Halomonas sp. JS92-SW72]AXY42182.1 peptidase S1 [Halomonas sp. JS92-SW72]
MTRQRTVNAAAVCAALAFSLSAAAWAKGSGQPDWRAAPLYDTVTLAAGFVPDPWERQLQAGGGDEVGHELGPGCTGYINASAPDVDLNYQAANSPLYIHVVSDSDTTLVVNGPDGRWYCNDDFSGLDPALIFQNPLSGYYNIWVGVHGSSELRAATLRITELNPF